MPRERKRRRPDGKQELRTLDGMLAEAIADDGNRDLPGKGKPLNLGSYFTDDPQQRVANKLLKDNDVMPPVLQDRADADQLRATTDGALVATEESLTEQLEYIFAHGAKLAALLPADGSAFTTLDGEVPMPDYVSEASGGSGGIDAATVAQLASELAATVDAYNSDRERAISRCQERLTEVESAVKKANIASWEPGVSALPRLPPVDVEDRLADLESRLPALQRLTPSLLDALKRSARKGTLQRLCDILLP